MRLGTQNMTEGRVTDELRRCAVVLGQEVAVSDFRRGLPDYRVFLPTVRAPGLGIAWDRDVLRNARPGAVRFHRSGDAEGYDFATPARGMAWVRGDVAGVPCVFFTVWLLNSWQPINEDPHTAARRAIVTRACLPVIRRHVRGWQAEGLFVAGGGDGNSITAALELPGLDQPDDADDGLDRLWVDEDGPFRAGRVRTLRKTGRGPQMYHHGLAVDLTKH